MSVTLLGDRWSGPRLRLERASELGLGHSDVVGWSDFYGGGPCDVHVALATNGREAGYLVWGGNLGLRMVPGDLAEPSRNLGDALEQRPLLWLPDPSFLPEQVRAAVVRPGSSAAGMSDFDSDRPQGGVRPDLLASP